MLPKEPAVLLSAVNAKLRDEYNGLDDLCAALDMDETALSAVLAGIHYRYDPAVNQFIYSGH